MSFLNAWMALSNFTAIIPLVYTIKNGDVMSFLPILFVSIFSTISHYYECHKHGMIGDKSPLSYMSDREFSYMMNRFDVLGCTLVIARFLYLAIRPDLYTLLSHNIDLIILTIISYMCNFASERVFTEKEYYIPLHSVWHVTIYPLIYLWLTKLKVY